MRESRTHDMSRGTGVEVCWRDPVDAGRVLNLYGWSNRDLRPGDYVLLKPSGELQSARYKLTEVRRQGDPRDQWFGVATFAPRAPSTGETP